MSEIETTTAKVESLGKDGVKKKFEEEIIKAIDKYVQKGFTPEETLDFYNQISQYFALTQGMGIDGARRIVTSDQLTSMNRDVGSRFGMLLGSCPSRKDKENGDKIGVNKRFVGLVSSKAARWLVPAKSLLTAGVILVGHESTHAKQGMIDQKAEETPWDISEKEKEMLVSGSFDPSTHARGLKKVFANLSTLSGEKIDASELITSLGFYFGKSRELDARNNGITFCRDLYEALANNPEIENHPKVKQWIAKQDGMIGLHEKTEKFLDRHILSKYRKLVESCKVPNDRLIQFAKEQEKSLTEAIDAFDPEKMGEKEEDEIKEKQSVYDTTIRLILKNKSNEELQEIYAGLDEESAPHMRELIGKNLQRQKELSGQEAPKIDPHE